MNPVTLSLANEYTDEKVGAVRVDLDQEIQDRIDADEVLDNKIEVESGRAKSAEDNLDDKIDAETERALAAEALKQNKTDNSLQTTSKTVVGAINEVNGKTSSVYRIKGSVATYADLPTNAEVGDVYDVLDTDMNYVWTGSKWDQLGTTVDLSAYRTAADQDDIDNALDAAKQDKFTVGTGLKMESNTLKADVVDDLDTSDHTKPLAAAQAPVLVDYIDASITDTMRYIDQQDQSEHAGRVAGDNLLQANKQDKLTAGTGISINSNNVISATGGSANLYLHRFKFNGKKENKSFSGDFSIVLPKETAFTKDTFSQYMHNISEGGTDDDQHFKWFGYINDQFNEVRGYYHLGYSIKSTGDFLAIYPEDVSDRVFIEWENLTSFTDSVTQL